jgi:chloride channel protein, CIC family
LSEFDRINQERWGLFPKAALLGLLTGVLAVAFRWCLAGGDGLFQQWVDWCHSLGSEGFFLLLLLTGCTTALAVFLTRTFAPEAAGSGIPHVKQVLLGRRRFRDLRVLVVKFLSGMIGISGGLALGREGPTVQMGAALGWRAGRLRPQRGEESEALLICGAAAGLAAAFNAPLAALIFVLEELQVRFNQSVFFAAGVAALLADVVARSLAGELPVFHVAIRETPTVLHVPHALVVGLMAGILGILFNRALVGGAQLGRTQRRPWLFLGGILTVAAIAATAWFEPRAVGGGLGLTDRILDCEQPLRVLALLFTVRFLLTVASYSLGSAGGIFAPILLLGGLLGLGMGEAGRLLRIPWTPDPAIAALTGMGALFAAVVRWPLTGIVLLVEMTGYYPVALVLLTASFVAVGVADFFHQEPVYESLMALNPSSVQTLPTDSPPASQPQIPLEQTTADDKKALITRIDNAEVDGKPAPYSRLHGRMPESSTPSVDASSI